MPAGHQIACMLILLAFQLPGGAAQSFQTNVGQSITLPCHPSQAKPVVWSFEPLGTIGVTFLFQRNAFINGHSARFKIANYSLVILSPQKDDSGLYTCIENDGLDDKHQIRLQVTGTPLYVSFSGQEMRLPCRSNDSAVKIQWRFEMASHHRDMIFIVSQDDRITPRFSERFALDEFITGDHNLVIKNTRANDSGVYMCTGSNGDTSVSINSVHLMVTHSERAVVVASGSEVSLGCNVYRPSSVSWTFAKNGSVSAVGVNSSFQTHTSHDGRISVLNVDRVDFTHGGIYSCTGEPGSVDEQTYQLVVCESLLSCNVSIDRDAERDIVMKTDSVNYIVAIFVLVLVVTIVIVSAIIVYLIVRLTTKHEDSLLTNPKRKIRRPGDSQPTSPDAAQFVTDRSRPEDCQEMQTLLFTSERPSVGISPCVECGTVTAALTADLSLTDSQCASTSTRRLKTTMDNNSNQTANDSSSHTSLKSPVRNPVGNSHFEDSGIATVVTADLSMTDSQCASTSTRMTSVDANSNQTANDSSIHVTPVLSFNKATPSDKEIHGVCVVGDKLYVARSQQFKIDIYARHTMALVDQLPVTGDGSDYPGCMTFDTVRHVLYISYYQAKRVNRIRPADGDCKSWSVKSEPDGVAVTPQGVLVTFRNDYRLVEFEPDGKPIREIQLDRSVSQARHAIPYGVDEFLICFGYSGEKCGMCLVNGNGAIVKPVDSKTEHPLHVEMGRNNCVFVADHDGNKVTMLDSRLEYVMDAIPKDVVSKPFRLCVDTYCEKLYIGDYYGGCREFDISYK